MQHLRRRVKIRSPCKVSAGYHYIYTLLHMCFPWLYLPFPHSKRFIQQLQFQVIAT